jgi:hypothetical protein
MDQSQTNILAYVAFAVGLASSLLAAVNHTRIRSACCGKKIEMSFDVEKSSPKKTSFRPEVVPEEI